MRIADMNWFQVEEHVGKDDRCVLPLGSTEQHAYLSLCVDQILSERVAVEAAEPLGVPVYPALAFGMTPNFVDFPGTISIRLATYAALLDDILESLHRGGFRRIVIVNGHGGNAPALTAVQEWLSRRRDSRVKWHNWWNAPKTWAKVIEIDPEASHASWMENFPWTRLDGIAMPDERKPQVDMGKLLMYDPADKKRLLGDGNYHGLYQRPDSDMKAIWQVAVEETRALIAEDWS